MARKRKVKVKLSDVAAAAQVSVPAASMALANHPRISPQTRRKVWALSRRLGYRPAAAGARRPAVPSIELRRLGFACLGDSFDRPVNAVCFAHVTAYASRMNVRMDATCVEDLSDDGKLADALVRFAQPLDGLLLIGSVDLPAMRAVAQAHIPCVALGDQPVEEQRLPLDVVTFDHVTAGRLATGHLLRRGHRRVAFLCDTQRPGGSNLRWRDGYRLAHFDAGASFDPRLVAVTNVIDGGTERAFQQLVGLDDPPTAWVVVNTHQAAELLIMLNKLARPDEVCGVYSDKPPQVAALSAILYPLKSYCDAAMSRLVQLCKTPGEPATRVLVPFETYNIETSGCS